MPRSSAQSDFVVAKLPRAVLRSDEATARSTRWVMTYMWLVLAALFVLATVGPHIPGGE